MPVPTLDLQQVGLSHPRIKQAVTLIRNTATNRNRLFVAEGLWASNALLAAGLPIRTFFWCPEAIYSDEAGTRRSSPPRLITRECTSISVIGCGYLGAVHAASMVQVGREVASGSTSAWRRSRRRRKGARRSSSPALRNCRGGCRRRGG